MTVCRLHFVKQMGVLQEQGSHFPYDGKEFPSPGSQRWSQTNHTIDTT